MLGVVLDPLKPRVSCQNGNPLRRVENGRCAFQIVSFRALKKSKCIAEIATIGLSFLVSPTFFHCAERDLTRQEINKEVTGDYNHVRLRAIPKTNHYV